MIRIAFCFFFVCAAVLSKAQTDVSAKFIGTWMAVSIDFDDMTEADSIEFEEMKKMLVFIFEKEGVFKVPMPEDIPESMSQGITEFNEMKGAWNLEEGEQINICFQVDDCEILEYTFVDENRLILSDGLEGIHFIRK